MARVEIKIAGFGGQGIITLGRLIVYAANGVGKHATETIAYGGEARGGSSWADVVVDDEEVDYPRCSRPDFVILFSQEAAATFGKAVRDKGMVLYDPVTVEKLTTREDARVFPIAATTAARQVGAGMVANTVMFGAWAALSGLFPLEAAQEALQGALPAEALGLNLRAFQKGVELARGLRGV